MERLRIKGRIKDRIKEQPPNTPPSGGRVSVKKTSTPKGKNTFENVQAAIIAIDLEAFHSNKKYAHLNIDREFEAFQDHFLYKNDAKGNPNWLKWSHWNKAFHNWLSQDWKHKNARRQTQAEINQAQLLKDLEDIEE